jgi:hypothetical protein
MRDRVAGNWWVENLLRPVLIAAMMVCLTTLPVRAMAWFLAGWDGTYFLVFSFLASLEGILSERTLQKQRISGGGYLGSRAAEALVLLLLLKLASYLPLGLDRLVADARTWPSDPTRFVSPLDLLTGAVFVTLWMGSLYAGRMVRELDVEEGKAGPPLDKTSTAYYLWLTQPSVVRDRQERLNWLGEIVLWGGVAMLLGSTGIHFLIDSIGTLALPILLYFALGVALLSQARFSVAHAGWQGQGIPIQQGIARRWLLWAVIFLVGVALTALLLPTGYAMGPARALLGVLRIVVQVAMWILLVLYSLLVLLLSFLFPNMEPPERPPLQPGPVPPAEPTPVATSVPWLQTLLSALFWIMILVILGYALFRFLRDRFSLSKEGTQGGWRGRFVAWLRDLWRRWRAWRVGVQASLARRRAEREGVRPIVPGPARFFSLRRLPPRELVRYFYLSAARRAAQIGQPRQPSQTPHEYKAALDRRFADLEPDLTGLTDAFVEARYSPHPVQQEDVEEVKPLWQRIKAALRQRRVSS